MIKEKKVWYVKFPTHLYNEDVKELALRNGLKVIDSKFQGAETNPSDAPKLTLKTDKKPAPTSKD